MNFRLRFTFPKKQTAVELFDATAPVLVKTRRYGTGPWTYQEGRRVIARGTNVLIRFQRTFLFLQLTWEEWHDASAQSATYEIVWTRPQGTQPSQDK